MRLGYFCTVALVLFNGVGCGGGDSSSSPGTGNTGAATPGTASSNPGFALYTVGTGEDAVFYRISAASGAVAVALDAIFDAVSAGHDEKMSLSRNGTYAVVDGTRFDCGSYACLARLNVNGSGGEKVLISGEAQHVYSTPPIISNDGNTIVFTLQNEAGRVDLVATTRVGGVWTALTTITSLSSFTYNRYPAFSPNDDYVAFGCSNSADESSGNSICEVAIGGSGFHIVSTPSGGVPGGVNLHHPSYAPDASIVFEGEGTGGEQIWRLDVGSSVPTLLNGTFSNDNTPCVLPNGNVLSLWLGRSGNTSNYHELKRMNSDGTSELMLVTGQDIADVGLSCSDL